MKEKSKPQYTRYNIYKPSLKWITSLNLNPKPINNLEESSGRLACPCACPQLRQFTAQSSWGKTEHYYPTEQSHMLCKDNTKTNHRLVYYFLKDVQIRCQIFNQNCTNNIAKSIQNSEKSKVKFSMCQRTKQILLQERPINRGNSNDIWAYSPHRLLRKLKPQATKYKLYTY